MKKLASFFVVAQLFMLQVLPVYSQFQPTEVVLSHEKTIVDGKLYYVHTVVKGQTLTSICKAYEVTQDDIRNANPGIDLGIIKEGQALRIPDSKSKVAPAYPQNKEDFYAHVVKKGQTVFSLSKKFKIPEETIYQYNPWARNGIQPDQTLWIPRKDNVPNINLVNRVPDEGYFYYTVKEKDTLYSISKMYGVSVSDIIDANPDLRNGLKAGLGIRIPHASKSGPEEAGITDTLVQSTLPCSAPDEQVTYDIALMLPLFAASNLDDLQAPADSANDDDSDGLQQGEQGFSGKHFAEFYEGFMLALDSLKEEGLSVVLHVYDTEHDSLKTKKIVRELSQIQPALIVGPVYPEDVKIVGRYARYQNIPLVSPLSAKPSLISNNPEIFQVFPSRESEIYALANYLRTFSKGRIILVRDRDKLSVRSSWLFKKYLLENPPRDVKGSPLHFKDYRLNDSLLNVLGSVLSRNEENIIVVFSESEPKVSRLVGKLYIMTTYPVKLVGMPSWPGWKTIDLIQLHKLQLSIVSPFYTDYDNPRVKKFLLKSKAELGYEPYEIRPKGFNYCMLGYDIGLYFLSALHQHGKNFLPCIDQVKADQLLTRYLFRKSGNSGGWENYNFNLIQYRDDYTVERTEFISGQPVIPAVSIPAPASSVDSIAPVNQPLNK